MLKTQPLLIIFFDGCLGFLNCNNLYLKPGVRKFVNRIYSYTQIVIATKLSPDLAIVLSRVLTQELINYDGVYSISADSQNHKFVVYDQIYKDFRIKPDEVEKRVLVLSTVNLDRDYMKYSTTQDLLFSWEGTKSYKSYSECNCIGVPIASKEFSSAPITIFVQNPAMDPYFSWMSLK